MMRKWTDLWGGRGVWVAVALGRRHMEAVTGSHLSRISTAFPYAKECVL